MQRTYWHGIVDKWLKQANILDINSTPALGQSPNDGTTSFYDPVIPLSGSGINVVYLLESKASHETYVGSTNDMITRLRRHNSSNNPVVATAWARDWMVKAIVRGFEAKNKGRRMAYLFEVQIQSRPMPTKPDVNTVLHCLLDQANAWRQSKGLALWVDY